MNIVVVLLVGLLAGCTSGLFGVGGGIVTVPLLIFLLKVDPRVAIGTSLLAIVPTAVMAAATHLRFGQADWKLAAGIAAAAMVGAVAGAGLAAQLPVVWLKRGFALLLVFAAVRLLWK